MSITIINKLSQSRWPGSDRTDLPADDRTGDLPDGTVTHVSAGYFRADPIITRPAEPVRTPMYQYVDSGSAATGNTNILWTSGASFCTLVGLWTRGRVSLAHIPGDEYFDKDITTLIQNHNMPITDIYLINNGVTGSISVLNKANMVIKKIIGDAAWNRATIYLIMGFDGNDWKQSTQFGLDPKAGGFPVFHPSSAPY